MFEEFIENPRAGAVITPAAGETTLNAEAVEMCQHLTAGG
jgi:hypothetical protein